jgi:hypothetical protein
MLQAFATAARIVDFLDGCNLAKGRRDFARCCDRRPDTFSAMATDARQALLRKAAALIGREELALGLKVPATLLDAWMNGHASMPARKLAALAGLLNRLSEAPLR